MQSTDFTPRLEDWLASKQNNEKMIVMNKMQIQMAQEVLQLCNRKIKELEKIQPKEEKKKPTMIQ